MGYRLRALVRGLVPVVLAAGLVVACASEQERYEEHRANAEEHLKEGHVREALLELRSALKLRPTDADVNFRIAEVLNARGDYAEAAFFYGEARRLDPTNVEAAISEAMILRFDEPQRAKEILDELAERDPSNALVWAARAHLALAEGDLDRALQHAQTAVELDPDHPEPHSVLGNVQQARIRERRLARERVDEAIFQGAVDAFQRAHDLRQPAGRWAETVNLAETLATWPERADEAPETFRRAVEEAREHGDETRVRAALLRTADYARRGKDHALHRWALEQLLEIRPDSVALWRELAQLEEDTGGSAETVLQELLASRPQDPVAHLIWSGYLFDEGRFEEAAAHLRQQADEGVAPAVLLGQLARMQFQMRRVEEARDTVARLEREHPEHMATALAAAQLAIAEDRPEDAVARLRKALDTRESVDALKLLADAELRSGKVLDAVGTIDRAVELAGEDATDLERLRLRIRLEAQDCEGAMRSSAALRRRKEKVREHDRVRLAECFYENGQRQRGRMVLSQLMDKSPSIAAIVTFARREGARSPERARQLLDAALDASPGNPLVIEQLTALDLRAHDPERAVARLDAALEGAEEPHPRLLLARARAQAQAGNDEAARRDALAAYRRNPELQGTLLVAAALDEQAGRRDDAIALLEEAAREGHLDPSRREFLARLYLESGRADDAMAQYEELLRIAPDNLRAKNDLAYLLAERGEDFDRAMRLAEEAVAAAGDHPLVADTLGYVYLQRGLTEPALRQFDHAMSLAEKRGWRRPEIVYHRGLALQRMGREAEARSAFEEALAIDADFAKAEEALESLAAPAGGDERQG